MTSRVPASWCSPSTFWVMTGAERPGPLELGDRAVAVVGLGGAEALPPDEAARPVALARLARRA